MEIKRYIDLEFENMLASLDRLIRIPSVGGEPEAEAPFGKAPLLALEEVLNIASEMGFYVQNYENRVGIIDFNKQDFPAIGILCHTDVVPAGNHWIHEPYRAPLDGENIYGRGTIDDKGPLISVLYAMKYLKEFYQKRLCNIRLIVGTDEERGSQDLAYYREREKLPEIVFTPDASYPVINTEKGRAVASFTKRIPSSSTQKKILSAAGGGAVNAVPDLAEAVVLGYPREELERAKAACPQEIQYHFTFQEDGTCKIIASGKSAHASLPEGGENAVTGLIFFLSILDPAWRDLSTLCPHGETNGKSLGIACSDLVSGALTFSFDVFTYMESYFIGTFDIRFPLCQTEENLETLLKSAFSAKGFSLENYHASSPHHTDADSLLVRTLLSVYEEGTGQKGEALAIGGGTYAHGIPGAAAFGPELPGADNHMHAEDEFISISNFKLNTELICRAISELNSALFPCN